MQRSNHGRPIQELQQRQHQSSYTWRQAKSYPHMHLATHVHMHTSTETLRHIHMRKRTQALAGNARTLIRTIQNGNIMASTQTASRPEPQVSCCEGPAANVHKAGCCRGEQPCQVPRNTHGIPRPYTTRAFASSSPCITSADNVIGCQTR